MGKRHDKSSAEAPEQHPAQGGGEKTDRGRESSLQGGREGAVPAKSESGERSTFPKKEDGKAERGESGNTQQEQGRPHFT